MIDDGRFLSDEDRELWRSYTKRLKITQRVSRRAPTVMQPQTRLDLHGMTQENAYAALVAFITLAQQQKVKRVLVITGKGRAADTDEWWQTEHGVLKREVPKWLHSPALRDKVSSFTQAKIQDGGEGALYVYLRPLIPSLRA